MIFVVGLLKALIVIAWIVVLGRVVMSWIDPYATRPVSHALVRITEPVLGPIRNTLPRTGALDLSPLVVLLILGLLMRIVLSW